MPLPSERATKEVQDRQGTRGHPGPIYVWVAEAWNHWLSIPGADEVNRIINPTDVAMMMALLKMGRELMGKRNEENPTDICGFMDVYEMVRDYEP